jgi:hypothetical protein
LYEVLRSGRFVLLTSGPAENVEGRLGVDHAIHSGPSLPAAVLVRPDGDIAWAKRRQPAAAELPRVLTEWCGKPAGVRCAIR